MAASAVRLSAAQLATVLLSLAVSRRFSTARCTFRTASESPRCDLAVRVGAGRADLVAAECAQGVLVRRGLPQPGVDVVVALMRNRLHPAEAHLRPVVPEPATPAPDLSDPDAARAWLNTERPCLTAVSTHTATHGRPTHAIRLSLILYRYLIGGRHTDALTHHTDALTIAEDIGNPGQQARAHSGLGDAHRALDDTARAVRCYERALALYSGLGMPEADGVRVSLSLLTGSRP
ncbi:tetratricopeptide repeat protein [Streptomyces sp. NPDC000345]|uniref:tetratricopeptide repeat protein n=1 Tax=Streptomyces sp. NPDC000345 TaxID=3364537 RepID=UPI0036847039